MKQRHFFEQTNINQSRSLPGGFMQALLFLVLSSYLLVANAAAFKCNINGVVTYSDKPCAENAQALTLPDPRPKNNRSGKPSSSVDKYHQINTTLENARQRRQIERDIKALKLQLDDTQKERDNAINQIKQALAAIDYAADDFDDEILAEEKEKALNAQLQSTQEEYAQKLEKLNAEIAALKKKLQSP